LQLRAAASHWLHGMLARLCTSRRLKQPLSYAYVFYTHGQWDCQWYVSGQCNEVSFVKLLLSAQHVMLSYDIIAGMFPPDSPGQRKEWTKKHVRIHQAWMRCSCKQKPVLQLSQATQHNWIVDITISNVTRRGTMMIVLKPSYAGKSYIVVK